MAGADRAYNPARKGILEVSSDGGTTYSRLHNFTDLTFSGGDRESTTVEVLDHEAVTTTGSPQPKDISVSVNVSPATKGYRQIYDAYKNETEVTLRYTSNKQMITSNSEASRKLAVAATTGVVTAMGTINFDTNRSTWIIGRIVKIGTIDFVIESITSATEMVASRADGMDIAAVAATDTWSVWRYGIQVTFPCDVLSAGNFGVTTGGDGFTESLTLKGIGVLPFPTFVTS